MVRRGKTPVRRLLALVCCAALLCGLTLPAFAEGEEGGLLDPAALTALVEDFLKDNGIPAKNVGIGFCYTATGEEWFYNPDTWFYPASVYKVPLMMVLAEHVSAGLVSEQEVIAGLELPKLFDYIIIHSNNDYAHQVRTFLGGDEVWRGEAKQYAGLADDYYDPDYMEYCYFSPRYITKVVETLYADPERFPMVLDRMLKADQAHYFRLPDEMHVYDIAQKYGSYLDMQNSNWNHTTGIIYTPNPFVLTVMTLNVQNYEWVIGQLAVRFKDYVLGLDAQLAPYVEEKAEQDAADQAAREEREAAERRAAEDAAFRAQEERLAAQKRLEAERRQQDWARSGLMYSLLVTLTAVAVLGALGAILRLRDTVRARRRQRTRASKSRR